jgi:hypothetical protein
MESGVPSSPAPCALRGRILEDALRPLAPEQWPAFSSGVFTRQLPPTPPEPSPIALADTVAPESEGPRAMRPEELARWFSRSKEHDASS